MAVVGALLRVRVADRRQVVRQLERIQGVSTFSVEEQERVGVVMEGSSLGELHAILTTEVAMTPGVLGAWPAFAHCEPDDDDRADLALTAEQELSQGAADG